jgi:hypothetical protein
LEISENAPTLCRLDLVRLNQGMRQELREHIEEEGKTLYEANV